MPINADAGNTYIQARQYDKAIEQLRKTLEMDQSFYFAHALLGMAYQMKGDFQNAIAEYQEARPLFDCIRSDAGYADLIHRIGLS